MSIRIPVESDEYTHEVHLMRNYTKVDNSYVKEIIILGFMILFLLILSSN